MRSLHFILPIAALLGWQAAHAQNVGISPDGAAPHQSALLDIDGAALPATDKKGLLVPRMTSTMRTAIPMPATGLLVYDTTTDGFWYFDGTTWLPVLSGNAAWRTTGNAEMDPAANFLGTTDDRPLMMRVNDLPAGRIEFIDFIDYSALSRGNTAIGVRAMEDPDAGHVNSAFGYGALQRLADGNYNTAIGAWAMEHTSTGSSNTALGYRALRDNTQGTNNVGIGQQALAQNQSGFTNIAIGNFSLALNNSGNGNVAIGHRCYAGFGSGAGNVAIGIRALLNTNQSFQVAIGDSALSNSTNGSRNTAVGSKALLSSVSGSSNTSVGYQAMRNSTAGSRNTAMGEESLVSNTGNDNTALGYRSMQGNSSGARNVGVGTNVMLAVNSGSWNSALGYGTLIANTTGFSNTTIGYRSGESNETGNRNTALGREALRSNVSGENNTALGHGAYLTGNFTNSTAIGFNRQVTADNQVRIGQGVISIGGPVDWTNISDGRVKRDVREDVSGLDFITRLRPVTYQLDPDAMAHVMGLGPEHRVPEGEALQAAQRRSGFIAQEVEALVEELGIGFNGVDASQGPNDPYGLRYAEFVVPLVKAVQEQQAVIELLREREQDLADRLEALERLVRALDADRPGKQAHALPDQNNENP